MSEALPKSEPIFIDRALALVDPQGAHDAISSEHGALMLIDKPYGDTSFHVVARVRYALSRATGIKKVKVGHAGTLDPLATGLLIIGTRRSTKLLDSLLGEEKTYLVTLRLGVTSESFDLERPITIRTTDFSGLNAQLVETALVQFRGEIMQTPPIHSAIKQNGKPVYERARRGDAIEMVARQVTVYSLTLESCTLPSLMLRVRCSKGTYIRTLVCDLGEVLGTGAVMTDLVR